MLGLLADSVFLVHGAFVILAMPSALLAFSGFYRRFPSMFHFHNFSIAVMVAGFMAFNRCILVELEDGLRTAAGEPMPYGGSYIHHVVRSVVGIELPAGSVTLMSAALVTVTLAAVVRHWRYSAGQVQSAESAPAT